MRRLVLFLFALALLCQGALAALSPDCGFRACCATAAADAGAPVQGAPATDDDARQARLPGAELPDADTHAPCDASPMPCEDNACQCHLPGLTALLAPVPVLPEAEPDAIVAGVCLRQVAQHVPDSLLRPPHPAAR